MEDIQPLPESQRVGLLQALGITVSDAGLVSYIENCVTDKPRVLILYNYRLFFGKVAGRGVKTPQIRSVLCHILDVREIRSPNINNVTLVLRGAPNVDLKLNNADVFLSKFRSALLSAFPDMPPEDSPLLNVEPTSRLTPLPINVRAACGGFIFSFHCALSFYNCPPSNSTSENVRHIYRLSTKSADTLNLSEFELTTAEEVKALMLALSFNTWFKKVYIRKRELVRDITAYLGDALKKNRTIQDIDLCDLDVPKEIFTELLEKAASNPKSALQTIRISNNLLEDKAAHALAKLIDNSVVGIHELCVNGCGLERSSLSPILNALKKSSKVGPGLKKLSISQNRLSTDASAALGQCLASATSLEELEIAGTAFKMEHFVNGVAQGCINSLVSLDVSRNRITKKETLTLCAFLRSASSLKKINFSETELPAECMAELVDSMQSNKLLSLLHVNFSFNDFSGSSAAVASQSLSKASCISILDMSDCNLGDEGLTVFLMNLIGNKTLFELNISGNYRSTGKPSRAAEIMAQYIQQSCLESLIVRGTARGLWRHDMLPFIEILDFNSTLKKLDISSNMCGDRVIISLAKAIHTNRGLVSISVDDNGISIPALEALRHGLSSNSSIKVFPIPVIDISKMTKESDRISHTRLHDIVEGIQTSLRNNQNLKLSDVRVSEDCYDAMSLNSKVRAFFFAQPRLPHSGEEIDIAWKHGPVYQYLNQRKFKLQTDVMNDLAEVFERSQEQISRILEKSYVDLRHSIIEVATEVYGDLGSEKLDYLDRVIKSHQRSLDRDEILQITRDDVVDRLGTRHMEDLDKVLDTFALSSTKLALENVSRIALERFTRGDFITPPANPPPVPTREKSGADLKAEPLPSPPPTPSKANSSFGLNFLGMSQTSQAPAPQPLKNLAKAANRKSVVPPLPERRTRAFNPDEINLRVIEVESNLNHMTLDRAPLQKKRPPTRIPKAGATAQDFALSIEADE